MLNPKSVYPPYVLTFITMLMPPILDALRWFVGAETNACFQNVDKHLLEVT